MLEKIFAWLKSDTVKTLFAGVVLNGVAAMLPDLIQPELLAGANVLLGMIAAFFRINIKTAL